MAARASHRMARSADIVVSRRASRCPHSLGSGGPKADIEAHPAGSAIAHGDAGAVRPDDLHDDRQSEPCPLGSHPLTAPETIEDALSVLHWYARSAVRDTYRAVAKDFDDHLTSGNRMRERVFDQIAKRVPNRGSVTGDRDRVLGADQRNRPAGGQRQMRHRADYLFCDLAQIDPRRDIQ